MEIKDWGGGLYEHEVSAIEKIKQAFQPTLQRNVKAKLKGLESLKNLQSMFPWQGYSGFRFVDGSKDGEFDLIIITHCNVLIVELKHWNSGKITYNNDTWFFNDKDRGRSPVSITRKKQFLLEKKLNKYKQKFTNKGYCPQVHFLIVMTGNADWSELPDNEKLHIMSLPDFLELANEQIFDQRFRPHPDSKTLNQDFAIFDKIFGTDKVKSRPISMNGYTAINTYEQPDFGHPTTFTENISLRLSKEKHRIKHYFAGGILIKSTAPKPKPLTVVIVWSVVNTMSCNTSNNITNPYINPACIIKIARKKVKLPQNTLIYLNYTHNKKDLISLSGVI